MTERYYRFAGVEIAAAMPEMLIYQQEYRLAPFSVETVRDPHGFRFEKVDALTPPEGECITIQPNFRIYRHGDVTVRYIGPVQQTWEFAYLRVCTRGKENFVQAREKEFPNRIGSNTLLDVIGVEHLIARNDGFIFHCSYIDHNGRAILFTAPSETGKSTQAELWHRHRGAEIINGDRAAVRLVNGELVAEGIPFAGSSEYCKNRSLPIEAIVYLAQAPQTSIRKMRGYEAFSRIWEGVSVNTWDKEDMERVSYVVQKAAEQIPVYHLPCTPDESAVIALEEVLKKQEAL